MKKDKVIRNLQEKIDTLKKCISTVENIPLETPIEITVSCHKVINQTWEKVEEKALAIAKSFSAESIRFLLLAFPNKSHPFPRMSSFKEYYRNKNGTSAIRISNIRSWKVVTEDCYPLYLNADIKSPEFLEKIKGL